VSEVPWFSEPPKAHLIWNDEQTRGYLHFTDPEHKRAVIQVSPDGPFWDSFVDQNGALTGQRYPVWGIEVNGNEATVRDSVHFVGHWHSPNPVKFILVDDIESISE
jgi:hypothetical protein